MVLATTHGLAVEHNEAMPAKSATEEEFQFSDSEKREVEKLFDKIKGAGVFDLSKILNEAFDGDPVAMYIAGQCSLSGTCTSINRKVANTFFKMSASLGYAPALFEVFSMYTDDEHQDPLVSFVYLNLTISFGHKEYRDLYYQQTGLLSKMYGVRVVNEIERLALVKIVKINEMQKEIGRLKGTYKPAQKLMNENIVSEDRVYNDEYWKPFFGSVEAWKEFFGRA